MTEYDARAKSDPALPARRPLATTAGPIFGQLDFVAGIVAAIMILGPLAMAAFWVPYH